MNDNDSFRTALYGNSVKCSFGNLDTFLNDLLGLRTAVSEQCEELGAAKEDIEAQAETLQRIRTLFELPDHVDIVDGIIKRIHDMDLEVRTRDIKVENLSRALTVFAMLGEGPWAICPPEDLVFNEKDEEGGDILCVYRDFHDAAKMLEKHGVRK